MENINDLLVKLPGISDVAMACHGNEPTLLYPLKDAVVNLQMAYFWWREADNDLNTDQGNELTIEGSRKQEPRPPSLIGAKEQLDYLTDNLKLLSDGTQYYLDEVTLPPHVKYKVEQGYNKVMEARFHTEISTLYYKQFADKYGSQNTKERS